MSITTFFKDFTNAFMLHSSWRFICQYVKYLCKLGYLYKPVERDRHLFGSKGIGLLMFALTLAWLVPLIIYSVSKVFQLFGVKINLLDTTDVPSGLLWGILSQYSDPGNLPQANGFWSDIIAFVCAVAGVIVLAGLLVSSIVNVVSRLTDKWRQGTIVYDWNFRNYVVIIGVNEQTATIAKHALLRGDVDYVLIQTRQSVEKMRMEVGLSLDDDLEEKLVFYFGERTSREDIRNLHLEKVKEIYILGEDTAFENEEDHDAYNIECLEHISQLMTNDDIKRKRNEYFRGQDIRLRCHVAFEYQSTFSAFKVTHLYQTLDRHVEFLPFNIQEIWAKKVLVDNYAVVPSGSRNEVTVQHYLPLDGEEGIGVDSPLTVHLVIVGMTQMGVALGMQAALLAHYPNAARDRRLRTTITFIDKNADIEGEYLRGRYEALFQLSRYRTVDASKLVGTAAFLSEEPSFIDPLPQGPYSHLADEDENFMDIQWEFIKGNVASDVIKDYIEQLATDREHRITTVAICLTHPQQSMAAALYLPRQVFNNALQVLVYQQNSFSLANNVATGEKDWLRYSNLKPFGMIESCYSDDTLDNMMAKVVNYLYLGGKKQALIDCLERFDQNEVKLIEKAWEELRFIDKLSNLHLVETLYTKLRSMGIHYEGNPLQVAQVLDGNDPLIKAMSYSEHLRWVTERLTMGFRPLDDDEADDLFSLPQSKRAVPKSRLKLMHRAHVNICPTEQLHLCDPNPQVHDNDRRVILCIPLVLRCNEWLTMSRLLNSGHGHNDTRLELLRTMVMDDHGHMTFRYVENGSSPGGVGGPRTFKRYVECHHSFWMAEAPVTCSQWKAVTGQTKGSETNPQLPVTDVTKQEVDDFLLIFRKQTGLYFTIPSIKEWEYAARISTSEYLLHDRSNWPQCLCYDSTQPRVVDARVKQLQPNRLGIFDLLGNVWEWTRSEVRGRKDSYYFCGGSWDFGSDECSLYNDYWCTYWHHTLKSKDLGLRLVWKFEIPIPPKPVPLQTESERKLAIVKSCLDDRLVKVNEGYFIMGTERASTADFPSSWGCDKANVVETPHHIVKVSEFRICSIPVTQKLWNIVMGDTIRSNKAVQQGDNYPQTNVSYDDIVHKFLPKLNALTGRQYRLPTEAEWEYAAKGGHNTPVARMLRTVFDEQSGISVAQKHRRITEWLEKHPHQHYPLYPGSNEAEAVACLSQSDTHKIRNIQEVMSKSPNELGLYDMGGNIWEWCMDVYNSNYYDKCLQSPEYHEHGYVTNPCYQKDAHRVRVFRGGSWKFDEVESRSTARNYWKQSDEDDDLGFRLVLGQAQH